MMPIGHGKEFETVSNEKILEMVRARYGAVKPDERVHGNGPAVYYNIPGFCGSVGFISAMHGKFCGQCNRIRLTSIGELKPCLCYGEGISVKDAVRNGRSLEVRKMISQAVKMKPEGHSFERLGAITEVREMAKIGG